jgi:nucleotide-binding universal stress UspA family protein
MKKRMKILVTFDGSEPSTHALNQGASLAQLTESEIIILSVVPKIMTPLIPEDGMDVDPIPSSQEMTLYQQKMEEYYSTSLRKAVDDLAEIYPELKVDTMLKKGRPSSTIVDVAEQGDFDLIVIGNRGVGGIFGWILGSTSRRVVESCTVPVLVVK